MGMFQMKKVQYFFQGIEPGLLVVIGFPARFCMTSIIIAIIVGGTIRRSSILDLTGIGTGKTIKILVNDIQLQRKEKVGKHIDSNVRKYSLPIVRRTRVLHGSVNVPFPDPPARWWRFRHSLLEVPLVGRVHYSCGDETGDLVFAKPFPCGISIPNRGVVIVGLPVVGAWRLTDPRRPPTGDHPRGRMTDLRETRRKPQQESTLGDGCRRRISPRGFRWDVP